MDCIFILHSAITKVLDSGQKLYAVFIDYEKCFDKIERSLLWQKLLSENVSCKVVKAVRSMYITVKSYVNINLLIRTSLTQLSALSREIRALHYFSCFL